MKQRAELKARVQRVLGGWGAHSRLVRGLGIEHSTLQRVYSGETVQVPEYLLAVIELLEALPPKPAGALADLTAVWQIEEGTPAGAPKCPESAWLQGRGDPWRLTL